MQGCFNLLLRLFALIVYMKFFAKLFLHTMWFCKLFYSLGRKKRLSPKIAPVPASSSFQSSMQGCVNFWLRLFCTKLCYKSFLQSYFCTQCGFSNFSRLGRKGLFARCILCTEMSLDISNLRVIFFIFLKYFIFA